MSDRQRTVGFACAVLGSAAALAWALAAWGLPLSNDGATHVFQAWVHNHYADPGLGYQRFYELNAAVTSALFVDVQRVLEPLFGWQLAWQLNVQLCAQLWAFGFLTFTFAVSPRRRVVGLLGFPLALQAALWLGLMEFYLAVALCWFALALWLRPRPSVARAVALAALLLLAARAHVLPPALLGLLLVAITLRRAQTGEWRRELARLVGAGLPASILAWRSLGAEGRSDAEWVWPDALDRLLMIGGWFQSGPVWRGVAATALVMLSLCGVVLAARRRTMPHNEQVLAAFGLLMLALTSSLPLTIGTWQFAGLRALPLGVGALLALLPVTTEHAVLRRLAQVGVLAYLLGTFGWAHGMHTTLAADTAPVLAGLSLPPSPVSRAALMTRRVVPPAHQPVVGFEPFMHFGNLYAISRGGLDHYGQHGNDKTHHLKIREEYRVLVPAAELWSDTASLRGPARTMQIRQLLARLSSLDELVMIGDVSDQSIATAAGFDPVFRNSTILLARNNGCAGRLELVDATTPIDIALGWWPDKEPTRELSWRPGPGAPTTLTLPRFGCGEVWVTVHGALGEHCVGAAPGTPLVGRFQPAAPDNVLRCTVTR